MAMRYVDLFQNISVSTDKFKYTIFPYLPLYIQTMPHNLCCKVRVMFYIFSKQLACNIVHMLVTIIILSTFCLNKRPKRKLKTRKKKVNFSYCELRMLVGAKSNLDVLRVIQPVN